MNNIINVEMPTFWISKENPRLVSYKEENADDWIFIQCEYYGRFELNTPKTDEIAYKYFGDQFKGYLLKPKKDVVKINSTNPISDILKELNALLVYCENNDATESFMWRKVEGIEEAIKIVEKYNN